MLAKLGKKIPSTTKVSKCNPPFIFTLLKKCKTYCISYELMCRLNYFDLLYLIVEFDIEAIRENLHQLEMNRLEKRGVEIVEATDDQILTMHQN